MATQSNTWWKDAVVYQIYPASFRDANGDGVGDLKGIISQLDYIRELGADVIWICPMYDSPQYDMGYDVRDYQKVYAPYGNLDDMNVLIREAHSRGIRVVLDLVINHSSHEHRWFKESRSSKSNPKRDWYIWKPAKYDANGKRQPPTNWRSNFGGSTWEWDEATEEYYLHLFCVEQPDLNWENEETRKAIYEEAIVFWLERGVDGFRVDTVNIYSKPQDYPDAPVTDPNDEFQPGGLIWSNGPRMTEFLREINAILSKYNAMSVGECANTPDHKRVLKYVSAREKQLDMAFQFDVVDVGGGETHRFDTTPRNWKLAQFKDAIRVTQEIITGTDAWTTVFLENHDQARSVSRFGNDSPEYRVRSAKMLALFLATLSGTLYIYQGQEIGMINIPESWPIEEYKDVDSSNYYRFVKEHYNNDPKHLAHAKAALQHMARDHSRTPMQWNASKNGGFTSDSAKPWMRVNDSTAEINVEAQTSDPDSVLSFWKHMLALRKQHAQLFVHGDFKVVDEDDENIFSYTKTFPNSAESAYVVCNFSSNEQSLPKFGQQKQLKYVSGNIKESSGPLQPWESRVYLFQG